MAFVETPEGVDWRRQILLVAHWSISERSFFSRVTQPELRHQRPDRRASRSAGVSQVRIGK